MGKRLEIKKQVWVNSPGKKYSVDLHDGTGERDDYLMITEHNRGNRRYRIAIPLPMVGHLIEAIHDVLET